MNISECMKTALSQTKKHPARSLLTILGIVIGIAVMTAVLSVGEAGQDRISYELDKFGMNRITVYADENEPFKLSATEHVKAAVHGIDSVAQVSVCYGSAKSGQIAAACEITGCSPNIFGVEYAELYAGRFLNADDTEFMRRFAVIGENTACELFGTADAVGKTFSLNGHTFTVVGVKTDIELLYGSEPVCSVYVPISTFDGMFGSGVQQISFEADNRDDMSAAVNRVTDMLYEGYGGTITVLDLSDEMQNADSILKIVRLVLASVAVMSLIVGGIGIMNIMLVTVRERKKEIGIRKALGANDRDILRQFMCEALLYSLIGAAIGVVLGMIMTAAAEHMIGLETSVSLSSLALSVAFSAAVGMAAGILPALKAAKLDPVEALRSN